MSRRPLQGSRVTDKGRKGCESQVLISRLVAVLLGKPGRSMVLT